MKTIVFYYEFNKIQNSIDEIKINAFGIEYFECFAQNTNDKLLT